MPTVDSATFAGLLSLMGDSKDTRKDYMNLCAISKGSAHADDLPGSLKWKAFYGRRFEEFNYAPPVLSQNGRIALVFDIAMALHGEVATNVRNVEKYRALCPCRLKSISRGQMV